MRRVAGALGIGLAAWAGAAAAEPRLIWSDEFDAAQLDPAKWTAAHDCWGGGNNERQCYTPANVSVSDGLLRLTARRELVTGPARPPRLGGGGLETRNYSSGRIDTQGKASFRYGRIEVRAKLPKGQGFWPAIWMLPEHEAYGPYPASGEIDIAEVVNPGVTCDRCHDKVHGAVHHGPAGGPSRESSGRTPLPQPTEFHVFALHWTPAEMRWSVDGHTYFRRRTAPPFDQRFHLILNLAVGGRWPESTGLRLVEDAAFPAEMVVDWVRVWETAPEEAG